MKKKEKKETIQTGRKTQIEKIKGGIVLFLTRDFQKGDGFCEIYKKDEVIKNTLATCSVFTDGSKTITSIHLSDATVAELAVLFKNHVPTVVKE